MRDIEGIKEINSGNQLHRRALAYCTNNPGVGFADACARLTGKALKAKRARKSLSTAKGKQLWVGPAVQN